MKLLVTNDDGIESVFFHELISALRDAGHELYVVAPQREQSWVGAGKTRTRPVKAVRADRGLGCATWIVDGTPSDCVNIGLAHLLKVSVDGVVSGINVGMNCTLGFILASGTVAGAWEGALHGLPALAFSQDVTVGAYEHLKEHGGKPDAGLQTTLRLSAARAARMTEELLPATPSRGFIVHNVNFPYPCRAHSTVRRTVPARFFVPGLFSPADDDGTHRLIWKVGENVSPPEPLTDHACLAAGSISHTVLDYTRLGH
ncbi:MAG: 5'/3'-nucleotidase SurE [Opitutaceae bacterium]|nr:5'/3'-nucleotidase SurE [Opitutaceae bacterium]